MESEFKVFYIDDGTIGGKQDVVIEDLEMFEEKVASVGLCLNHAKSEVICSSYSLASQPMFADMKYVPPHQATLLGSPIGDSKSIDDAIINKIDFLKVMGERIRLFRKQEALLLLRNALAIPKVLHLLRTSPCFSSPHLLEFDHLLRSILSSILNVDLSCKSAWLQASLPVSHGGIGIRSASMLATSTYLASAAGCQDLIVLLIPSFATPPSVSLALQTWSQDDDTLEMPQENERSIQKAWDTPKVEAALRNLISSAPDARHRARILAASTKESGLWLQAPINASLGLRMEDNEIRIAAGLRLGVSLVSPHLCQHCGIQVITLQRMV